MNEELAVSASELVQMLNVARALEIHAAEQYFAHGVRVNGPTSVQDQQLFYQHGEEELKHAALLRDLIHDLGGNLLNTLEQTLTFNLEAGTGDVDTSTTRTEMLEADLLAETGAVEIYTHVCARALPNFPDVFTVVSQILRDEREHVQEIKNLLAPAS